MKQMKCNDFGGPCDQTVTGETFEEIGKSSHDHVKAMMEQGDEAHMTAANAMRESTPEQRQSAMEGFQKLFDDAPSV